MMKLLTVLTTVILFLDPAFSQQTQRVYLSGKDKDNTVDWEFYCSSGLKSEYWTTIPVPSNWECEGFGTFNYGQDDVENRGKEQGFYRYHFHVPKEWKSKVVNIIFEGSMTDTQVKINGRSAGEIHQGAFYQFSYNISDLLKYGSENLLEVTVAKHSANESVNEAERKCDYWIFGGIYRPVFLEAKPKEHIERVEIDARADGTLRLNAIFNNIVKANLAEITVKTLGNKVIGSFISKAVQPGATRVSFEEKLQNIKTWSTESPNLYIVEIKLKKNKKVLHIESERFGFRTVEIKGRDGIYVNGVKIKFKGINHHSFWPSSGKTTSKQISIDDVNLMKDMNMNAVRMSHYPPDKHFLEVCDSLGLFVLDELAGWQTAYDTEVGEKLVHEMIFRDMNHPSIIIWDNGNEGGWNTELDYLFDKLDIQKRPLIHPYQVFRKTDTDHYQEYNYGTGRHQHGNKVVFPTEFLHGLYDGGHGAGLEDYWCQMWDNPISAGGFLWDFSDQAVVRTDKGGVLDTDGNHGADGILGPYREKEGSFFAVKEIWSPVYFEKRFITSEFNGEFIIENRFHYTNLNECKFTYQLASFRFGNKTKNIVDHSTIIKAPDIKPNHKGTLKLNLPNTFYDSDVLYITCLDPFGREVYTWSWPITLPSELATRKVKGSTIGNVCFEENDTTLSLKTDCIEISWGKATGLLQSITNSKGDISFNNGPILIEGDTDFDTLVYYEKDGNYVVEAQHSGDMTKVCWTLLNSGWLKLDIAYDPPYKTDFMGISFSYPEELVNGMQWIGYGPYRVWKNRIKGNTLGVWQKDYNNTITGHRGYIYPEFKGYHKGFYWVKIQSKEQDFEIVTESEGIFLRMFTPDYPENFHPERIAPKFPLGDISFMHGINPIGTKILRTEQLGPMSQKNIFSNRRKEYKKELEIYFNFILSK